MKIGILTFHRALNYGAFLQAYATKSYLTSKGYEVEIVDYWPKAHADYVNKWPLTGTTLISKFKQFVWHIFCVSLFRQRKQKMRVLQRKYLGIGEKPTYTTGKELSQTNYDAVIYGSDQIWWNHAVYSKKIAFDKSYWGYYLPARTKRIAYAPSMGIIDIREQDQCFLHEALAQFSSISVRETTLRDALTPFTNQQITTVLDPVFLPDKQFWLQHVLPRQIKEPYLLYYSLIPTPESRAKALQIAEMKRIRLVEVAAHVRDFRTSPDLMQTADAIEFLSLIYYADYVVSTSFHGTAFSIIMEKEFCVTGLGKQSGRVVSLLSQLGIEERYTEYTNNLREINYNAVRERLAKLQKTSRKYLTQALTKA